MKKRSSSIGSITVFLFGVCRDHRGSYVAVPYGMAGIFGPAQHDKSSAQTLLIFILLLYRRGSWRNNFFSEPLTLGNRGLMQSPGFASSRTNVGCVFYNPRISVQPLPANAGSGQFHQLPQIATT
jgi:hypothetical protein